MEVITFFKIVFRAWQEGVVLLEILLVILLLGLLAMQSLAIFNPVLKGMRGSLEETQSAYAGVAVLEMLMKDAVFRPAYGEWDVSTQIPWNNSYTITLNRAVYPEWPSLDQYTVTVGSNDLAWLTFTTLIRSEY